jgi:hypothetical protein
MEFMASDSSALLVLSIQHLLEKIKSVEVMSLAVLYCIYDTKKVSFGAWS